MEHVYGESVIDFGAGDRVELHPATDAWMRGDRFGTVQAFRRFDPPTLVRVRLDRSGRSIRIAPDLIRRLGDSPTLI